MNLATMAGMTFAKIWIQVKKGWGDIHQEAKVLRKRVAHLELAFGDRILYVF